MPPLPQSGNSTSPRAMPRGALRPAICDFTFGNPHEMPLDGIVSALRDKITPHDKDWFAYKTSEQAAQEFLADTTGKELGLAFEPADIALTTGAFAAISVAFRLVLDAGDEALYREPAWFCYGPTLLAADAVPVTVAAQAADVRPGPGGDRGAHRAEDRMVIVNTPHNPTGRIYDRAPAAGAGGSAGSRLDGVRPTHIPAVRRALPAAALRRTAIRQCRPLSTRGR